MKRSKEELLQMVRDHGGETPDEFCVGMLEDIADSFVDAVDNTEELATLQAANEELTAANANLQSAYDTLMKNYADRFTLKESDVKDETQTKEEKEEEAAEAVDSYDSIF